MLILIFIFLYQPRRTIMEQISRLLSEDSPLPECIAVAPAGVLSSALAALHIPTLCAPCPHVPDARPLLQALYSRTNK